MTALRLYAFTRPDAAPEPGLEGVGGAPVAAVDEGAVRAWCSPAVAVTPADRVRSVAAHHRVVEAAWTASSSCAPARFGQQLAGREALRSEMAARQAALEAALDDVAGCVEMGIRIFAAAEDETEEGAVPPQETGGPGRTYLLERARAARLSRAREARARALAEAVEEALVPFLRQATLDVPRNGSGDVALAHLIQRGSLAAYRSAVHDWAHARSGARVVVEGPWPPYSFAVVAEGGEPE